MKSSFKLFAAIMLPALLLLTSCSNSNTNYPEDYVGFEKSAFIHYYDVSHQEETIDIKIIAIDKEDTDRVVKLTTNNVSIPGIPEFFELKDKQLTIKAGKKSVSTQVKVYPPKAIKHAYIQITCTPQWKDGETTQLAIRMEQK